MDVRIQRALAALVADEKGPGTVLADAPLRMALVYPSPYRVAMSSLGYLQIHRRANRRPGTRCERGMRPAGAAERARHRATRTPLLTVESRRPVDEFHVIAFSQAYELEMIGIAECLELAGLEPRAADRTERDPLVVLGGPITNSNPFPSSPFADVVVLGEGEGPLDALLDRLEAQPEAARGSRAARRVLLDELAGLPGFFVPRVHGNHLPPIAKAEARDLPAVSEIRTPRTELSDMVLIEPERGCHRGCSFCVMRRTTNGGMRTVEPEDVDRLVPDDAPRVGLVGAAVTDHPGIKRLLFELVDRRGKRIGISSLRADRLDDEFVGLLRRGGYRSLTVALDAPSARMRHAIEKNLKDIHIHNAADLARAHGMHHIKLYVVVGLPGETDEDRDELVQFCERLRKTIPVVLGVSPFVPKFHTPLAQSPFVGKKEAARIVSSLHRSLAGKVTIRGPGAREAYVEYRLSQGGYGHVEAAIAAARAGGSLGQLERALRDLPERVAPTNLAEITPRPTRRNPSRRFGGALPVIA